MKDGSKDFLSKRTKRGVILMALLCLVIAFAPRIYRKIVPQERLELSIEEKAMLESKQQEKDSFRASKNSTKRDWSKQKESKNQCVTPEQKFDPNTYQTEDWQNLGLSQKQADVVVNFAKHGLSSLEDLKKIFVLDEAFIACIKDSLIFPEKRENIVDEDAEVKPININTANKEQLMTVRGVGKFYADKIIKLRSDLGGIHSIQQLSELPYMDEEKMNQLKKAFLLMPQDIQRMNINTATTVELKQHPYITYNIANSIVKMRTQLNGFTQLDEIQKSVLIDAELFQKLKPYLSL